MDTVNILGVNVTVTNMEHAVQTAEAHRQDWKGKYICICNVHATVTAHDDPALLHAENGAVMVMPDGGPLSVVQRRRGYPEAGRVTGPDFMEALLANAASTHTRHYFYGSTGQTQALLKQVLARQFPQAVYAGGEASLFRPLTEEENDAVVNRINQAAPDYVWIGLGAPRQELWMAKNQGRVQALMTGVGGAFDVLAGNVKRAPLWMQKCCLEWLYRLLQEPKRLFKRYFVTNTRFLYLLAKERRA